MATIPVSALNLNPGPFHNHHVFPYNLYRGSHHPQHNPVNLDTIGLISALPPHHHQLNYHRNVQEDLVHLLPKGAYTDKEHDFCIYLDVGLFAPQELTVKIVNDHLIIEGIHEERQAHDIGYVTRHFKRRYELPKDYNPDDIVSELSSDGVLNVVLPKTTNNPKVRMITIQQTGPSYLFAKNKSINGHVDKTENGDAKAEMKEVKETEGIKNGN